MNTLKQLPHVLDCCQILINYSPLTLCVPIDSSFWFYIINLGRFMAYTEGLEVIIPPPPPNFNFLFTDVECICEQNPSLACLHTKVWQYSKPCPKRQLKRKTKNGFQNRLSLNAGQKYCRMLQGEHSAILLTFIRLPFVFKTCVCLFWSSCLRPVLL